MPTLPHACFGIATVQGHGTRHVALLPAATDPAAAQAFAAAFRAFCAEHGLREASTQQFITNT